MVLNVFDNIFTAVFWTSLLIPRVLGARCIAQQLPLRRCFALLRRWRELWIAAVILLTLCAFHEPSYRWMVDHTNWLRDRAGPWEIDFFQWMTYLLGQQWYMYSFVVTVMLYAFLYDGCQNTTISRIYRVDKYGIVIVYAVLAFFRVYQHLQRQELFIRIRRGNAQRGFYAATVSFLMHAMKQVCNHAEYDADAQAQAMEWYNSNAKEELSSAEELQNSQLREMWFVALTCIKVCCFAWIFKNHTSQHQTAHQSMHLVCVGALGVAAIFSHCFVSATQGMQPDYLFWKLYWMCIWGSIFQLLTNYVDSLTGYNASRGDADNVPQQPRTMTVRALNAVIAFAEAMLIVQTF